MDRLGFGETDDGVGWLPGLKRECLRTTFVSIPEKGRGLRRRGASTGRGWLEGTLELRISTTAKLAEVKLTIVSDTDTATHHHFTFHSTIFHDWA